MVSTSRQVWLALALGVLWASSLLATSARAAGPDEAKGMGSATISQGEWARLLVDRLGASGALPLTAGPEDAASLLGARGFALEREARFAKTMTADGAQKTWRYDVDLPRTATWLVTLGNAQPAFASVDKSTSKLLAAGGADGASDLGLFPLAAGAHTVTITSTLAAAPDLDLVAGCHPVLPAGGWNTSAKLNYGNLGRTLVQALRQNGRLPASDGLAPVPVTSSKTNLDVPSEGTYSVLLSGKALERATYRIGGCEETTPGSPTADGWREGTTVLLTGGATKIEFASVDAKKTDGRVRLVRRSSADAEYLAVLQSMGVKLTTDGKTTGSIDAVDTRTGLARRAKGDATGGLAALAGRTVTRAEAERILDTPVIAKQLGGGVGFPAPKPGPPPNTQDQDAGTGGTLDEPVTGTLQRLQDADP